MKMFKKLLAVALAGVLALSVLTGCDSSSSQSLLDALNKAGTVKFTANKDADYSKAEIEALKKNINATAAQHSDWSRDEVVENVLVHTMAEEELEEDTPDGEFTVEDGTMIYAVIWDSNKLSVKQQATTAIDNAKKLTLDKYTVKGGIIYEIEYCPGQKTTLSNAKGYEVSYATLNTSLGTCILVGFSEAK